MEALKSENARLNELLLQLLKQKDHSKSAAGSPSSQTYRIGDTIVGQDLGNGCALLYDSNEASTFTTSSSSSSPAPSAPSLKSLSEFYSCMRSKEGAPPSYSLSSSSSASSSDAEEAKDKVVPLPSFDYLKNKFKHHKLPNAKKRRAQALHASGDLRDLDGGSGNSVVLDLIEDEFWTLVDGVEGSNKEAPAPDGEFEDSELAEDDDPWVVVNDEMVLSSISQLVLDNLKRIPEAKGLDDHDIIAMVESTCAQFKEPSLLGKAWAYGNSLYSWYTWGQVAVNIYKDPTVAKMVVSWAWQAATWAVVILL